MLWGDKSIIMEPGLDPISEERLKSFGFGEAISPPEVKAIENINVVLDANDIEMKKLEEVRLREEAEKLTLEGARKRYLTDRRTVAQAIKAIPEARNTKDGLRGDLEKLGFKVEDGYFRGEDLDLYADKGKRRGMIGEVARDLEAGKKHEKLEEVLGKMGIDPNAPEYKDIVERWIEEEDKEPKRLLEYFSKHDVELNGLLLQEWDDSLFGVGDNNTRIVEICERSNIAPSKLEEMRARLAAGDRVVWGEMFDFAQELYLNDLCGMGELRSRQEEHDSLTRRLAEIDPNIDAETIKYKEDRSKHYDKLSSIATGAAKDPTRNPMRSWDLGKPEGQGMVEQLQNYLLERYGVPEIDRDNSELGLLQRVLNEYQPKVDCAAWVALKEKNDPDLKDEEKLLLREFANFRRFAHFFDSRGEIDKSTEKEIDKALSRMVLIQNEAGKEPEYPVAEAIVVYQKIMKAEFDFSGGPVDIDSDRFKNLFRAEYGVVSGHDIKYAELSLALGRDIVRLTGMDAKYALYTDTNDENKLKSLASSSGGLLRDIFNFRELQLGDRKNDKGLVEGIRVGAIPFWNKIRGGDDIGADIKHRDFTDSQEILNLFGTKITSNGKVFGEWAAEIPDKVKAQLDAEKDFLKTPTFEKLSELGGKCGYMKKPEYMETRFSEFLKFIGDSSRSNNTLGKYQGFYLNRTQFYELFLTKFFTDNEKFDGKNILKDINSFKKFFNKVPTEYKSKQTEDSVADFVSGIKEKIPAPFKWLFRK